MMTKMFSLKANESVTIGPEISVRVTHIGPNFANIAVDFPDEVFNYGQVDMVTEESITPVVVAAVERTSAAIILGEWKKNPDGCLPLGK